MHRVMLLAAVMMRFAVRTGSVGIDFGFMSRPTTDEIAAKILEVDGVTEGSRQYGHPGMRIVYRFEDKWFTVTWNEKKNVLADRGQTPPYMLPDRSQSLANFAWRQSTRTRG